MSVTFGMVADRLSDLVAELREIGVDSPGVANVVETLDGIREGCDYRSVNG